MAKDLNKVMLIGRTGKDVELRYTQGGTAVANFSLATNEKYKDNAGEYQEKTEWHNIVVWGKLAEIAGEYLKKGSKAYFEGKLQTRKWDDKDGNTRYSTEVVAQDMIMLGGDTPQDAPAKPRGAPKQEEETDSLPF